VLPRPPPAGPARRLAFARRPVWLLGHVIAGTAVVGFVILGQWQLGRHEERRILDARVASRVVAAPEPLDELIGDGGDLAGVEYRQATVTGTYVLDDEVILQARSLDGRSGHEVLTPLLGDDGTVVIVDRGWVPIDATDPPVAGAEPPTGGVTVTGFVRLTQVRRGLGPQDPAEGRLTRISRVDIDRLATQIDRAVRPVWLQLASQAPAQPGVFPIALDPPQPGGGPPHLSYAVQWFAFAVVVVVAYPLLLARNARRRGGSGEAGSLPTAMSEERQ